MTDTLETPQVASPSVRFTDELATTFCRRLAAGETLKAICSDEDMPSPQTVWEWRDRNRGFRAAYDRAREIAAEHFAGETIEIADDGRNDWMTSRGEDDAGWRVNGEHVRRSEIRIKSRQWYASKLAPGRFGERSQVQVSGQLTLEHLILGAKADPAAVELAAEMIAEHDAKAIAGPTE